MSIFALSDLHLPFGEPDKTMEIFSGWAHYTEQIEANWYRMISDDDTVVLAGDTSWGMKLETALPDFLFLQNLPGQKIILKGNHDYWWTTAAKMNRFFEENQLTSLHILHNNSYVAEGKSICGTRGWLYDGTGSDDARITVRECGRLAASLQSAQTDEKLVFLHYPPAFGDAVNQPICDLLRLEKIDRIFYGHIHGNGRKNIQRCCNGIEMHLISCDSVGFVPVFIA